MKRSNLNLYLKIGVLCLVASKSFAQNAHFIKSGIIEYDKTSNMYLIINRMLDKNGAYSENPIEKYKRTQPQFRISKSSLTFSGSKTLFTPKGESSPAFTDISTPIADQNNIVYTDISIGRRISEKKVFEKTYLLKDSLQKIKWKITSETREIAGYTCHRANGLVLDSVYVVAFFTTSIPVSGGPESFSGLPGMIMGIALPHENVTWFATKVVETASIESAVIPPKNGEVIDHNKFIKLLNSILKNFSTAQYYFKAFLM